MLGHRGEFRSVNFAEVCVKAFGLRIREDSGGCTGQVVGFMSDLPSNIFWGEQRMLGAYLTCGSKNGIRFFQTTGAVLESRLWGGADSSEP